MHAKVDADHATDTVCHHSRMGFLICLNCALIYWSSKKQTPVESSSSGSEFVTMKQCCGYVRGLRYKICMIGVPCEGPTYIMGDNQINAGHQFYPRLSAEEEGPEHCISLCM